ncbi:MAG: gliding motility-associated C-terminal domain-containing protein [Bacteroidetes bacterium]|nr:gliding motility-associated C-terminal domain-containing protein [Bacteroidota bacterium]
MKKLLATLLIIGFIFLKQSNVYAQFCPSINAQYGTGPSTTICQGNCAALTASINAVNLTTSYNVSSIPFSPPYPITGAGTGVSVGTDDVWSPVINLPFPFCFYGNTYNSCLVGSNGVITFNTGSASGYCPWSFTASNPSASLPTNAIFGIYQDIDPAVCGNVKWALVGTAPCRMLVVNFNAVCYFSCTSLMTSHQMVLYETTNVIEVHVQNRPVCSGWNGGNGIIGIQNNAGTVGTTAPGRNTSPSGWAITTPEAWRFTPSGVSTSTVTWYGPGNAVVGTGSNVSVCPSATSNYTAVMNISACTGVTSSYSSNVQVIVTPGPVLTVNTATICQGNTAVLNVSGATAYTWTPSGSNASSISQSPASTTVYSVTGSTSLGCKSTYTTAITVNPNPSMATTFTNPTCSQNNGIIQINNTSSPPQTVTGYSLNGAAIGSQTVSGLGAGTYNLSMVNNYGCVYTTPVTLSNSPGVTNFANTTVNSTCGNSNGVINVGAITGGSPAYQYNINGGAWGSATSFTGLAAGTYTVGVKDANNCTYTKVITVANSPGPTVINFTTSPTACTANTGVIGITSVIGGTPAYSYSLNGVSASAVTNNLPAGTKTIAVVDANGCTYSTTAVVSTLSGPTSAVINTINATCGNSNGSATVASVIGGSPGYQYSFNGGAFGGNINTGVAAGPQNVVIKDVNGCTLTVNYAIGNTGSPSSSISNNSPANCFGQSSGSISISTSGGTPGYSYTLAPGNITNGFGNFTGLAAGAYTVITKDAAGCLNTIMVTISQPPALAIAVTTAQPFCNGGNNGTITVTGSGGTSPYQYNINGGTNQSSSTFTNNISAGSYNATVIDSKGCTISQTLQIGQPSAVVLTTSSSNANCTSANGTASVSATGGSPAYSYTWLPTGGNSAQTSGVTGGNYTVQVSDSKGCIKTSVVAISTTPGGTAIVSSYSNVTCYGFGNGAATAGITGPFTAPLTYSWSTGSALQTVTGLAPSVYTVTITDFYGCKSSASVTITQPALLDAAAIASPAKCFGSSTGTATMSVLGGGTPPYTYVWTPSGVTTYTNSGLSAGIYSATVTDANGCVVTRTVNITQPSSVTMVSSTITANCNQSNGAITTTVSGGTGPYTYTWSNGATTANLTNVAQGTYTVLVNDNNNCSYNFAVTIPNAAGPLVTIPQSTNVSCFGGNNGMALAQVSGGAAGPGFPTYLWSNGQTSSIATNLLAGIITVTITDAAGCSASTSVTISQPAILAATASGTKPKCFNATNGTATVTASGGTGPYTYNWSPTPGSGGTTTMPSNMSSGNYTVLVTDSKGCMKSTSVALANPAQLLSSISSSSVTCFNACNGTAAASYTNNQGSVSYVWTGGPIPLTTQSVSGLCAGVYSLTVTDANNCTVKSVVTITQPTKLNISISAVGNVSCAAGTNGFAIASATGGKPAYTYSWTNGQTVATASNLAAGNYSVTVTDINGCTTQTNVTITQPLGLSITVTGTNITCFGLNNGIGKISWTGGTGMPTILWKPSLGSTSTVNNLTPNTHTVILTDANGCQISNTLTITQPPALIASITNTVATNCGQSNGSASVSASGGTGGYTYQWSSNPTFTNSSIINVPAGTYTVIVYDANSCSVTPIAIVPNVAGPAITSITSTSVICFGQSNGSAAVTASGGVAPLTYLWSIGGYTTTSISGLPFGQISVTVKDAANCIVSGTVNITQPTQVVSAIGSVTNASCNNAANGGAEVLANGGLGGYTYVWMPGASTSSILSNVPAGIYSVTVSDINNCTSISSINITQPAPLTITTNSLTNILCHGGSNGEINTSISGGTPLYSIVWSPSQPANPVATSLVAGTYSLNISDSKGCNTYSVYTLTEPSALNVIATNTLPATCGQSNGSATVQIGGGTYPYSYNWNTPSIQTSSVATGMSGGNWQVITTDGNGCTITGTVNIQTPVLPTVSFSAIPVTCYGQSNGTAWMTATGVAPFLYTWNVASASSATLSGISSALYSGTITDVYGCQTSGNIFVSQPPQLILPTPPVVNPCYNQITPLSISASGGVPPYSYTWTASGNAPLISSSTGTATGTYTSNALYLVNITDANGCFAGPTSINVVVKPRLIFPDSILNVCDGYIVNYRPIPIAPGSGTLSFNWQPIPQNPATPSFSILANYTPNQPSTYTLYAFDECGADTSLLKIYVFPNPSIVLTPSARQGCAPMQINYSIASNAALTPVVNYWTDYGNGNISTANSANILYATPGTYSVHIIATSDHGCRSDSLFNPYINVYQKPVADFIPNPQSTSILFPNVEFSNNSTGASTYFWDFGDLQSGNFNNSNAINPNHAYQNAGTYYVNLVVTSLNGCKDTVQKPVEILPDVSVYIPNAFTPDGNGKNDVFMPYGVGISQDNYEMNIFDRWGELIFTSNNLSKGWNGKMNGTDTFAKEDVYVYKIKLSDIKGNKKYYVGHVTLLK